MRLLIFLLGVGFSGAFARSGILFCRPPQRSVYGLVDTTRRNPPSLGVQAFEYLRRLLWVCAHQRVYRARLRLSHEEFVPNWGDSR